jgi:hypothetical protein
MRKGVIISFYHDMITLAYQAIPEKDEQKQILKITG